MSSEKIVGAIASKKLAEAKTLTYEELNRRAKDKIEEAISGDLEESIVVKKMNKSSVMRHRPVLIGTVKGIKFYEDPIEGDEAPLIADTGKDFGSTTFWDLPTEEELA